MGVYSKGWIDGSYDRHQIGLSLSVIVHPFRLKVIRSVASIPPLDLTQQYRTIQAEIETAVQGLLASGRYIGGPDVQGFEQALADYIGVPHGVSCNSGTDALYLALRVVELQPGDEVITTPFTFFATTEVISRVGAIPVFVDIDPLTLNLDLDQVAAAVTPKTRGIIPVHLFGQPVDMPKLMTIAQAQNLWVIEDCAQAIGATWQGKKVGSYGDLGCFSFFPTKNLGAYGDGGAVVTSNPDLALRMRQLKEHGSPQRYHHNDLGLNSRLDALQAVILRVKLTHLDRWNEQRRRVAHYYQEGLKGMTALQQPITPTQGEAVWHQYTMRVNPCPGPSLRCGDSPCDRPSSQGCRDGLRQALQQRGIQTMVYYPVPLHLQAVYEKYPSRQFQPLRVAEQAALEVLSLPMYPELSQEQQDYIIEALKASLQGG